MEILSGSETKRSNSTRKYVERLINFVLSQEKINSQHYQISISLPRGAENTGRELETSHSSVGKSFGSAIYLALLSALHKKPISKQVAATGYVATRPKKGNNVKGVEIGLSPGTNLPIGGLKHKVSAAIANGVNRLVFSKYNSSPHLLSLKGKKSPFPFFFDNLFICEDYQQEVSPEVQAKIEKIY
jgi:predicted ATP-dependent protease